MEEVGFDPIIFKLGHDSHAIPMEGWHLKNKNRKR